MSTALKRLATSVQPSLRGRVFALLAGLTICACAGATATYWLAQHYLYATDILRQVNLSQQVGALSFSEQLSGLEADALAARQNPARLKDFMDRQSSIAMSLLHVRASEPMEAGREIVARMDAGYRQQSKALQELVESRPGEGALLVAVGARHRQNAQEAARELFDLHARDADLGVSAMRTLARTATTASLFVIPAGAVLGIVLGWVLLRQVLGPIRRLALGAALGRVLSSLPPGLRGQDGGLVPLLLSGALGAGKTTLVRGLVSALPGAELAEVSSPSFNIVNIYPTTPQVAHFDLYRVVGSAPEELLDSLTRRMFWWWPNGSRTCPRPSGPRRPCTFCGRLFPLDGRLKSGHGERRPAA